MVESMYQRKEIGIPIGFGNMINLRGISGLDIAEKKQRIHA
jgi:hypothetical protein